MADIYDQLLDEQTPQNSTAQPMQVAANEPDVYDKLLDEVQKSQRAAVDASIQQAVKVAPQQAATVQQLAKSTGLPEELVERNLDAVQTQEKIKQVQSLLSASPFLQRQMTDPNFAKLAQSDLESLGLFERTYRGLGGGAAEAVGRTIGGVGELIDIAQRNLTQAFASTFLPDAADGSRPDPSSLVGPRIAEGWQQTGDIVKDAARDIMVPALQQTFYDQVAAGLGQVGAQILAAVLTGGMTSVTSLYAQGADVMADMVENDPASQGMKDLAVLGGAALTGITEKWALDRILGPLAVPIQNQLGAALARIGIAGLSEGGQEALESIGQDALRQFLTNPEAEIRLGEALDEGAVGATVGAIVRTVVESAAGVRARHVRLENQAAQAEQNAATLEQLNQIAAADELLKISPETFEQFVAAAAEDGPVQAVYIDAQTLMQSGAADQLAQLSPSVQEQLAVAAATNGTVQIPIAEYASKIAPTEYAQSLLDHLKTDPQGFSRAEARDYLQTQQQQLEQEIEQALQMKADDVVFMESQQKVKDLVLNELNTLGRFTPQKNELDATLIAARSAVRAAQLGMTPEAFFESQRLRFAAERIDGDVFSQGNDPDLRQLAEFYAQDDEYQFDNFQEREDAIDALVTRYGSDDNFSGMQLPDGTGTITVTPSSKEPGKWQVTMFDRDMVPSADNGLQSKEDALRYFFEQARPSPELFQFAGVGAKTANTEALERAFTLESRGVTSAAIQRETGWYRGVDGRWRFEISDDRAAFKEDSIDMAALEREADRYIDIQSSGELYKAVYEDGPITNYLAAFGRTGEDARNNLLKQLAKRQFGTPFNINTVKEGDRYKLSDVLTHPELFAAYPEMAELTVEFKKDTDYHGAWIEESNTIEINIERDSNEMLSTLLHEIQHAIQTREDFARGGSPDQRFAQSVKDALAKLTRYQQERVNSWKRLNFEKLVAAESRAEVARNALMYESAQRLIDYSNRDKPSGVFRLIRNEMQWIYGEQFHRNDQARDLQRRFYDIPKRGDKRNAFIRDMAFDAAQFLLDNIPAEQRQQFKSDTRTMKGMIKALQREATKAREALNPLREIEKTARAAKDVAEATRYKGPYDVYRSLAGEIEARTTQARQRLTAEERRNRPVRSDMDVDPSEAIVVIGGRELLAPTVMMDSMQEFNQSDERALVADSFANTLNKKITDKNGNKIPVPRVYYRGEREGGDKSVSGAATWDKVLFASSNRNDAEMYAGSSGTVTELTPKPWARILYEGTQEFKQLNKGNNWGGKSGRNLLEWANEAADRARAEGYDAVWFTRQGDVGTAILNRSAFEGTDSLINTDAGVFFQNNNPVVDPERNLYVAHNIRPEGILAANELGALAAPSIAVARADIGFENFGDVTLIAEPSLLTSSKVRTFDADIYSPRQPRPEYDIPTKKWQAFESSLDPEQLGLRKPDWQSAERDGPQALAESDAMRYKFLQEQGKLPKIKQQKVEPEFKQAAKLTGSRWQLEEDAKFQAIAKKYYDRMATQAENADARRGATYRDLYFDEAGNVKSSPLRNFLNQVIQYRDSGGKDTRQFTNDLRGKLVDGKLANDYKAWVGEQFNALVDRKQIFKGFNNRGDRKYIPYTLENVVREMTQTLQAGENYFYGAGSVRSSVANEMKTIAQVQARRDQIVSEAEFETVKAESDQKLQEALDALAPFYKFDANSWGYAEDAGKALAEGPKGQREAFRITPESQKIIDDLLGYLRGLPTVYFEAKAQRPVQFSEFNTAVVPKGMRKDALQVLKDAGLKIKTYDPSKDGDRKRVVSEQSNLLFQGASRARGAYNPNTNTIALLKNADLSTFLHEAGHYFFESDINLAAEIVRGNRMLGDDSMTQGEQDIVRDVSQLLTWHGLTGDINAQLDQWFNLSFEEKRAYHEKTAESFERYLFEGTAPSIELQPYFQQFRAWLLSVYKSIKDFLTRNPAAGELTDEVRAVFDRMLATTEQIQLAQQARSMMPLFRTQAEADNVGMTPEEFAAYQAQDTEASNDAIKDLEAKGLRDLQWTRNARNREIKKLQRKAAELRREARIEARADVLSEPVYRAWQFLTGKLQDTDRIAPLTPRKSDPNTVDPTVDSLFTAMAKLGGINKQAVVETWGVEDSERPNSGVFGKPVLRREGGRTIDEMAELLAEQGYVQTDADGKAIVEDFELKFDSELRGEPRYSVAYDYSQDDAARLRPGEQVNILALGAGRLDLGSLGEYDLTDDQLKLLKSYRMTASSGLHPDLVAELPGIEMSSGDELVRRLLDATPLGEEIEARTDAIMLERYGELATPEAIEREADKAIHNEARARMVATEANALAKATGQRKVLGPVARQFAQAMVARSKVRDVKPSTYASAEARAAKAAEKASRAGDLTLAAAEKRNQLVNTYAAKAAYDALEQVDAGLRYLRKFEREGSRKGLDVEYLDQIDTLLERFDLRKGQSLRAIDKRTTLAQWVAAQEQAGLEPDIPDYIMAEANRTSYKNLTVEEFQGMVDSVKQIEHLGRLKKKLLTAKDQRELDAIVGDITARIEQSADGRVVDNEVRDTVGSKLAYFGRWIGAAHRKAASVARELDGLVDGGPMWEYFTRTMNEAGDREATMRADASKRLHELAKPILAGESMGGKGKFYPSLNRSLNRGERLAIALNWGNESNRQRLLGGKGWTAAQMQPVLNSLTSTEWMFVQGVWDFFESYRPEIAAKERRVYGKEPDWIAPAAFEITTADGQRIQVRGGYYPIKYDPKQSGKAGEFAEAEDAKAMMRAAYTAATTRRSFTKGRVEEVQGRPLLLTFDGIWQGANEVIHDLTWHEWLIDANRLLRRLDSPIRTGFGAEYMEILRKSVKDAARGDQPAANLVEKSLTHIRNGSTIVGMGWNITTALMQPFGYTNSVVRIGGKWMARGLSEFFGSPRHMIEKAEEVQAMSEMMRTRMMTMNREINDVRNRLTSDRSELRERIEGSYFIMIQKLQAMVDYPTWLGAYAKAIDDPANLNADGTINEARAAALADQAVLDAQGGGQIKDLAEVQRGNPLLKLFTNFYSYFNVLYNLTTEQTKKRVKAKEYAGLMGDYLLLMVVPAVLSAIIRNATKGEDDEDEYVKAIASELVGYPFGMFVGLREVAGAAQLAAGVGNPAFGYSGPAGLRFFSEMNKLGVQVGQGELDMALFKAANNVGGLLFHYPASQVNRAVDGSAALIDGETQNPLAPFVGVNRN